MNKLYIINYDNNIRTCTCKQTNHASTVCKCLYAVSVYKCKQYQISAEATVMELYLVLVCQHGLISQLCWHVICCVNMQGITVTITKTSGILVSLL